MKYVIEFIDYPKAGVNDMKLKDWETENQIGDVSLWAMVSPTGIPRQNNKLIRAPHNGKSGYLTRQQWETFRPAIENVVKYIGTNIQTIGELSDPYQAIMFDYTNTDVPQIIETAWYAHTDNTRDE